MTSDPPSVLLFARHHLYAIQIARELKVDLEIEVVAVVDDEIAPIRRSKYCDDVVEIDPRYDYEQQIFKHIMDGSYDAILPVGNFAVRLLDSMRDEIPSTTYCLLPPSRSLNTALNKSRTLESAQEIGIEIPREYATFDGDIDNLRLDRISYPAFLKAEKEAGSNHISLVKSEPELVSECKRLREETEGDTILIQEFVSGDSHTYGCGVLMKDNDPFLTFSHTEVRSIPRIGGTGTHVKGCANDQLY